MKRVVLILAVIALLAGVFSSCNKEICPAYSQNDDTEQVEINS
jgi:PBP1b-binding outer membrane lipoprotein LpoB